MTNPLTWNAPADKKFQSGVDRPVLYPRATDGSYPEGFAWEGLISVSEKPGGGEPTDLWANNVKYAQMLSGATFEGSIEAYHYPPEFSPCDGIVEAASGMLVSMQDRTPFGLSYRTYLGSEAAGQTADYMIHVIYGAQVKPSEVSHTTINDSPEAQQFSWDFTTTPAAMTGFNPSSKITLIASQLSANALAAVEDALYGDGVDDPFLPLPDALLALAETA